MSEPEKIVLEFGQSGTTLTVLVQTLVLKICWKILTVWNFRNSLATNTGNKNTVSMTLTVKDLLHSPVTNTGLGELSRGP